MKSIFEIKDKEAIDTILSDSEFGILALCFDDKPYSLPINFVKKGEEIYFHGSKNGKKMDILKKNKFASFNVVESCSLIPSFFSSNEGLACPATQFFKSIIIEGKIKFVNNYDEKVDALSAMMKKLQIEGGYKPLKKEIYKKMIDATTMYKLIIKTTKAKFKLGQHLSQDRFDMIIEHLEKRGTKKDMMTIKLMKEYR